MPNPQEAFNHLPRIPLAALPTPIELMKRLADAVSGAPHLYIKRDDSSNFLVGGNKIRKLEFTMADVLAQGATAVVTIGSIQSNHARITAMAARRLGLKCRLILNGDLSAKPTGNHLLLTRLGVEIIPVDARDERVPTMDRVAREWEQAGEKVYRIPLGASDRIGSCGMAAGLNEVMAQEKTLGIRFDAIVICTSSGGTLAGLEAGKRLFGREDLRILAISPDGLRETIATTVVGIANDILGSLGSSKRVGDEEVLVDDSFVGEGYGIPSEASMEATRLFSEQEGILLDPVYTAKSAAGLIGYCRKGIFPAGVNVLFWHTGGLMGLFV
jgi:D-cysteine desulfhydrase family pyridoxal phosphate-dependent enzyme